MLKNDWLSLPEEVRDFIGVEAEEAIEEIVEKFKLDNDQRLFMFDLLDPIFLKSIKPIDLSNKMSNIPRATELDNRLISLDFAYKVLWPMSDYLENVDRLILRLGGKVPQKQSKIIKYDQNFIPKFFSGRIRDLMLKYKEFNDLRVSGKKIMNKEGFHVRPSIDNWIKDYVHFLGAGNHDSLERTKYLSKSNNALSLNKEERENIRCLFLSYDEGLELDFDRSDSVLKMKKKSIKEAIKDQVENKKDINLFLKEIRDDIHTLEEKIVSSSFLLSEANNDINKIRNILWDSMGLMDKEKAISCVKVLIEKKSFDLAIKDDSRFIGILKRFLSIRYAKKMDSFINNNSDKLLLRRLFLEMLIVDKLEFKDQEAALIAFYLTNIIPGSGQIVYLDKNDVKLKWREVQLVGDNITWIDSVK